MSDTWLPMSTTVGPYLRIDEAPSLRDNFYVEYNITATEGLEVYMRELSSASRPVTHINMLIVISIVIITR
jgi:hypothetical protein